MDLARKKALLKEAEQLAETLGRYRTPSSGEGIDPSRVAEVSRFLTVNPKVADLKDFLTLLPGSFHARMSRSAEPQLREVARVVRPLIDRVRDSGELRYVLEWAKRILQTSERGAGPLNDTPRGGPPGRGPSTGGGPHGKMRR
jgi:hypothetical protein